MVSIMADAVKSNQELKNRLSSTNAREQVFMTVMLHDQSHGQSLDRSSISLLRSAEVDQVGTKRRAISLSDFVLLNPFNFFRNFSKGGQ